jgi:putative transposase
MQRYWTGSHTKHRLLYHLVFIPKYRRRVLRGKIPIRLRQIFYEACRINRWWIKEISIQADHVHMMIQINPIDSVAHTVQMLKGGSSRMLRKEFADLEEFLWGDSFWSDGYFAETVGSIEESVVKRYIRQQTKAGRNMQGS